jgi:cell shape-determining protein MreD
VVSVLLTRLAAKWFRTDASFRVLVLLQYGGCLLAAILFGADLLKPEFWLQRTAAVALAPGVVCFLFNFIITRMPR